MKSIWSDRSGLHMNSFITATELSALFDKVTNSIEEVATGISYETDISSVIKEDLTAVTKKNSWNFNWELELKTPQRQVYKLVRKLEPGIIQGLVCFELKDGYIEMHLIETAPHNFGKKSFTWVHCIILLHLYASFHSIIALRELSLLLQRQNLLITTMKR